MFYEISKILRLLLVSPISWMLIALLVAVFTKKRGRKVAIAVAALLFLVFTNKPLLNIVKHASVGKTATTALEEGKRYRVAIVLGGFGSMSRTTGQLYHNGTNADRLWEAVRLWRTGRVEKILISGDFTVYIDDDGRTTAPEFLRYMEEHGVPKKVFMLEQHSKNTRQNAQFVAEMLQRDSIDGSDCLLITTATHMRRSLGCFEKVGLHPTPFAVHPCDVRDDYTHVDYYPNWRTATEWEEVINEWVGMIAYRIVGYV